MILQLHDGSEVSIQHLAPGELTCPCEPIGRDLIIRVTYANHCYTEAFNSAVHTKEHIILYDAPDRARCFCPIRHKLSIELPELIKQLPSRKVHQTSSTRNYVFVVPLRLSNQIYEIYFMLQRAQPEDRSDLKLVIESAYPDVAPPVLPKRPNDIRFPVLAYKILAKQPVKFAAR